MTDKLSMRMILMNMLSFEGGHSIVWAVKRGEEIHSWIECWFGGGEHYRRDKWLRRWRMCSQWWLGLNSGRTHGDLGVHRARWAKAFNHWGRANNVKVDINRFREAARSSSCMTPWDRMINRPFHDGRLPWYMWIIHIIDCEPSHITKTHQSKMETIINFTKEDNTSRPFSSRKLSLQM